MMKIEFAKAVGLTYNQMKQNVQNADDFMLMFEQLDSQRTSISMNQSHITLLHRPPIVWIPVFVRKLEMNPLNGRLFVGHQSNHATQFEYELRQQQIGQHLAW
jgi:hypothetical protein